MTDRAFIEAESINDVLIAVTRRMIRALCKDVERKLPPKTYGRARIVEEIDERPQRYIFRCKLGKVAWRVTIGIAVERRVGG